MMTNPADRHHHWAIFAAAVTVLAVGMLLWLAAGTLLMIFAGVLLAVFLCGLTNLVAALHSCRAAGPWRSSAWLC